jgi:hypothetical protein
MKRLSNTVLWMALALGASGAMADTMRCGGTVIDDEQMVPATAAQVLAACGEPTSRESGLWVYQQQGEFTRTLQFDADGNLQSITEQPASD